VSRSGWGGHPARGVEKHVAMVSRTRLRHGEPDQDGWRRRLGWPGSEVGADCISAGGGGGEAGSRNPCRRGGGGVSHGRKFGESGVSEGKTTVCRLQSSCE
jgi:hypothetical protein